jgi:HD-like signal output (HDOD) protein
MTSQGSAPQEFEGRLAPGRDWREIVAWVGDLPPMPHVASRAISMVENPDTTAQELTDLLSTDTALAARVLKIANSAMFSRQREITTLSQAIMLIGFKTLKGIIVAATLRQINKNFGTLERMVWENSMCTATCANLVCKKLKKRYIEEIFLLGLLHSLGQVVLLSKPETVKDCREVMKRIKEKNIDFVAAEQEVMGFAHPLIGALVAKKWNFSAESCQVILHYRDPIDGARPESELDEKVAIVQLSDIVSHLANVGHPEGYPDQRDQANLVAAHIGFDAKASAQAVDELIAETAKQFETDRHVYG